MALILLCTAVRPAERMNLHFVDGKETAAKKKNAREEWLRIILRTREKTADLQKQIDGNKIFLCERHFKPDCIFTCEYLHFMHCLY